MLTAPIGPPPPGAVWSWVVSDDVWGEEEVLLFGVREGLEVVEP